MIITENMNEWMNEWMNVDDWMNEWMKFLYTAHITKSHGGLQFYSRSKHECER